MPGSSLAVRSMTAALLALLVVQGASAAPAKLAFLYMEGNVGGASGGHSALRVGDIVFHFQHDGDVFRLARDPWERFDARYRVSQNRPIHEAVIDASPEARRRVYEHLTGEHLRQVRRLGDRTAARDDAALLDAISERRAVRVPAAGLLDPARSRDPRATRVRDRIAEGLEPGAIAVARGAAQHAVVRGLARVARDPADVRAPGALRDAIAWREALAALDGAYGLSSAALLPASDAVDPLAAGEAAVLEALSGELALRARRLFSSERADRGRVLLVLLARSQALALSLDTGELRMLDGYPDEPELVAADEAWRRREELLVLSDRGSVLLRGLRARTLAAPPDEAAWSLLEDITGRVLEYRIAPERHRPVRERRERLVPQRSRSVALEVAPLPDLGAARDASHARLHEVEGAVQREYGYAITTENCVTELARAVNDAFGGPDGAAAALGGRLEPGEGLGFIPFVFHRQVLAHHAIALQRRIPSKREELLAEARARGRSTWREAIAPAAHLYEPRDDDGSFLLFTDQVFWRRPLYGVANLLYGAGDGLLGIASAPFDRARRLRRAGNGVLFTLPELAFQNVRKGSYDAATLSRLD